LARTVEDGPMPAIHGVVRWRIIDLCQWLFEEFGICASVSQNCSRIIGVSFRKP
jgi:hypothetical protein